MKTNAGALAIICESEGLRLKAYKCPAGVWTIGYGHTGPDVYPGLVITASQALDLLTDDLAKTEKGVADALGSSTATVNQFSAMVSLAYNIGVRAFEKSSVLRNHKKGNKQLAAASFLLWVKAKGRVLPGLTKRRMKERGLYLS